MASLGKNEEAIKAYQAVIAAPTAQVFVKAMAVQGLASVQETKGDAKGALESWKKLNQLDKNAFVLLGGAQQARLLESLGKKADALKIYENLKAKHGKLLDKLTNREYKTKVEQGLVRLGS